MARKKLYIVAYDVEDDKKRNKLVRVLEDLGGERVNYSVFEMMLSQRQYIKLTGDLPGMISPGRDRIILYPVCRQCYKQTIYIPVRGAMPSKPLVEV